MYWKCLNALQLRGRLDRIYIIDLVKAPFSVCVLPHLRLAQLVESPAIGDDPRRIRERTASWNRPCASLCNIKPSFFRNPYAPDLRAAYGLWGSSLRHSAHGFVF